MLIASFRLRELWFQGLWLWNISKQKVSTSILFRTNPSQTRWTQDYHSGIPRTEPINVDNCQYKFQPCLTCTSPSITLTHTLEAPKLTAPLHRYMSHSPTYAHHITSTALSFWWPPKRQADRRVPFRHPSIPKRGRTNLVDADRWGGSLLISRFYWLAHSPSPPLPILLRALC